MRLLVDFSQDAGFVGVVNLSVFGYFVGLLLLVHIIRSAGVLVVARCAVAALERLLGSRLLVLRLVGLSGRVVVAVESLKRLLVEQVCVAVAVAVLDAAQVGVGFVLVRVAL
ncbi:MAG: hypothetical protein HONDAALG_03954 [Gammaproteobacteria bacterium]|nr:hypothetical protein [Gammaproteobacteria bacterium]